ncbi:hypothetical protein [Microbacterium oleivorans]|uniref:hypothetical protein n=1 Tax=Microbacterium oleivorans TaxID=273677 RepID=UPI00080DCC55|nr:hypothetical protein [Microbacterium oleivorans]
MQRFRTLLTKLRDDRGSAGLEIVILAPALLGFLVLLAAAGRLSLAGNAVESAASAAAREASLARNAAEAQAAAEDMARVAMAQSDVNCTDLEVSIDTSGLATAIGTTGQVSARVTCTVELSDAALIGMPGTRDLSGTAISPVDAYRERR